MLQETIDNLTSEQWAAMSNDEKTKLLAFRDECKRIVDAWPDYAGGGFIRGD